VTNDRYDPEVASALTIIPVTGVGDIAPGDDIAAALVDALADSGEALAAGDVLVVTHKIVSKAEGRIAEYATEREYRDLVLGEAADVVRRRGDLVIARTAHGFICANAGVDRSNVGADGTVLLLPLDPDRSAHGIRMRIRSLTGVDCPVVVSDTFGRPWRRGLTDVAIGVSGIDPIDDLRGTDDMYGRRLDVTEVAVADELAAAADLVMGKATGIPAAIVRGWPHRRGEGRARDMIRPADEDLFR
jgi:coenzyme F420-0:L-glutamate ligase/coenzyme F420-1:gamma-L-glutamate ligase